MSGAGYIALTLADGRKTVIALDAIEMVASTEGLTKLGEDLRQAKSWIRTRSGIGVYVRDPYEPLAAMLIDRGRELSPAEVEAIRERVRGGGGC